MIDAKECIFLVKTKEAYVIKLLGELLKNTVKMAPFRVTENGISLTQADLKEEQLIDVQLNKENFEFFRCTKPLSFSVNSGTFHNMLKSIKKKDSIALYVTEADPLKLVISVKQTDESGNADAKITIIYNRPDKYDLPTEYESPVIMSNKDFQKMKTLHSISRTIKVTYKPGFLRFFCDGGELFSRELSFGEDSTQDQFIQHYCTSYITGLTKCANAYINGNVSIFDAPNQPMKIKMRAGNLGELIIFIKSQEMIECEESYDGTGAEREEAE